MDDYGEPIEWCGAPDYAKDPDSIEDYSVNWAPDLNGDTILTSVWELADGLTQESVVVDTTVATIVVSGGSCGSLYRLRNRITTAQGRTFDKTIRVKVTEQ